jgi:hypothetical protein
MSRTLHTDEISKQTRADIMYCRGVAYICFCRVFIATIALLPLTAYVANGMLALVDEGMDPST